MKKVDKMKKRDERTRYGTGEKAREKESVLAWRVKHNSYTPHKTARRKTKGEGTEEKRDRENDREAKKMEKLKSSSVNKNVRRVRFKKSNHNRETGRPRKEMR